MRVGLVCPYDLGEHGGVQDQVLRLARWLGEAGHDVVTIGPGTCEVPGFVSAGSATVIPANGAKAPVALSRGVQGRVVTALQTTDVAHVHEPLMPQVSLAALRHARVPMVGTFHADVSVAGDWVYRLGRPVTRRWFKRLNVLTAVSPVAARVLASAGRVRIIPNGIDHDQYEPSPKTPASVAFLGRDDERKGLRVLLEAWPKIREAVPTATLTVIGAESTVAIPGVQFLGRVSEPEKRAVLARSLVYCAPNLGGESFGIVVAEAMAAACAVVASGLPAFVKVAGETAHFVPPGDAFGLAREVIALLNDPEQARRLGDAARTSSARFGKEVVATAYMNAYRDAMAAAQGSGYDRNHEAHRHRN